MKIDFTNLFFKDYNKIQSDNVKDKIKYIIQSLMDTNSLYSSKEFKVKKIQGYKKYYRIKIGNYRLGLKKEENKIIIMRVMHRKDIYKYFPWA